MNPETSEQDVLDRQLKLLFKLSQLEEFQTWRDLVCRPVLTQLEDQLRNSDALPEPILRGTLKHYFSERGRFYDVFERATTQLQIEAEQRAIEQEQNPNP